MGWGCSNARLNRLLQDTRGTPTQARRTPLQPDYTHGTRVSLPSGTRIGPYEIVTPLGVGGMGEVYRARDSKLKREVALKVLPADVANDRERLARFQREAEVLASLNHPNIAHIHGLEYASGTTALVMELVEGEDLAERLKRGAIPIDEALLRPVFGAPVSVTGMVAMSPLALAHGMVFTAWVLLFVAQTMLVASRRVAVHRPRPPSRCCLSTG